MRGSTRKATLSAMDGAKRAELARRALAGYVNGPDAPQAATAIALDRVRRAEAAIIVEGICDQIAIETLAGRRGRDLDAEGIAVLPIGGAQAITPFLREFGPEGEHLELVGFCDADAAETFRRALARTGFGRPRSNEDMAALGFHVCVRDLEDELIRAVGPDAVVAVVESQGDLGSFHTFQKQPDWRDRPLADQLHRFFGSKARRSFRYSRLLVEALDLDRAPRPLDAVLQHLDEPATGSG